MTREELKGIADAALKNGDGLFIFLADIYDKLLDLEELIKQGNNGGNGGSNPA